jgi:chromosome segregation ATPase
LAVVQEKSPEQRRRELEGNIADTKRKLEKNQALLQEAEEQVERYKSFVASQSKRIEDSRKELEQLAKPGLCTAVPNPLATSSVQELEELLVLTEKRLVAARTASTSHSQDGENIERSATIQPTQCAVNAPGATPAVFNLGDENDSELQAPPDTKARREQTSAPY